MQNERRAGAIALRRVWRCKRHQRHRGQRQRAGRLANRRVGGVLM